MKALVSTEPGRSCFTSVMPLLLQLAVLQHCGDAAAAADDDDRLSVNTTQVSM